MASIDALNPGKKMDTRHAPINALAFKDQGLTTSESMIWSGDTLMDIERYEALKMTVRKPSGTDCLLVEAGGCSTKNPPGWRPQLVPMMRK